MGAGVWKMYECPRCWSVEIKHTNRGNTGPKCREDSCKPVLKYDDRPTMHVFDWIN